MTEEGDAVGRGQGGNPTWNGGWCWFDVQAEAIVRFRQTGELPDDDLHLEAVLVDVELDALRAHRKGRDVAELMALLDKVQRREGEEREEALKRVCAMAKEGRLS